MGRVAAKPTREGYNAKNRDFYGTLKEFSFLVIDCKKTTVFLKGLYNSKVVCYNYYKSELRDGK